MLRLEEVFEIFHVILNLLQVSLKVFNNYFRICHTCFTLLPTKIFISEEKSNHILAPNPPCWCSKTFVKVTIRASTVLWLLLLKTNLIHLFLREYIFIEIYTYTKDITTKLFRNFQGIISLYKHTCTVFRKGIFSTFHHGWKK